MNEKTKVNAVLTKHLAQDHVNHMRAMKKMYIISVFLAVTIVLTGCGSSVEQSQTSAQDNPSLAAVEQIQVVDFHGTRRCYSCELVERYAHETLETYFQKELEDGTISFQSINGELAENRAMVIQYQARGSSLFVNAIRDGEDHIEEDVMVWRLLSDEQRFKKYFKDKIEALLP